MNFLFIHQNFPGQYVHAARYLARQGHNIVSLGQANSGALEGVRRIEYAAVPQTAGLHDYSLEFDAAAQNGLAVARQCENLKAEGFEPDIVVGHNGWGETLFVKDVWPSKRLLNYFEFYYRPTGSDVDFDPEFAPHPEAAKRVRLRNAINLLGLEAADMGQTPTRWQHAQYPEQYRSRIAVAHEGVDTELVRPDPTSKIWLCDRLVLGAGQEVVTFCARNLEPYRGFHVFMRALPEILKLRPDAHVLILGGDGVSYGRLPVDAENWRLKLMRELEGQIDLARVHFLGRMPYRQYLSVLQLSSVHVYLTYPFVLSWSLLEALSAGCLVVASNTPPVLEAIDDGANGWLVDFFDSKALAERTIDALRQRENLAPVRRAARESVLQSYDLCRVCMPAHITIWEELIGKSLSPRRRRRGRASARGGLGDGPPQVSVARPERPAN